MTTRTILTYNVDGDGSRDHQVMIEGDKPLFEAAGELAIEAVRRHPDSLIDFTSVVTVNYIEQLGQPTKPSPAA